MGSKRKIKRIKKSNTRYLLSDTLPYEIPLIFSNKFLVRFLEQEKLKIEILENNRCEVHFKNPQISNILKVLFNFKNITSTNLTNNKLEHTIAYQFIINNKDKVRRLSVVHPYSQVLFMRFFEEYSATTLYYTNKSVYSLRHPKRVATWKYVNDNSHIAALSKEKNSKDVEEVGFEYETIRSYFSYWRYSNIFRFYESSFFRSIEKKFKYLEMVDVANCFDSIYTHSLAWSIYGKDFVKGNLNKAKDFANVFDRLMQISNYNETNGIVIGPEFSRIFAEIILQDIDLTLEEQLKQEGLFNGANYQICRYVDDYFIFYNKLEDRDLIKELLEKELLNYRFHLNESKTVPYERPFITNITIAKDKISTLFNSEINTSFIYLENDENEKPKRQFDIKYINTNNLITRFSTIISEGNVRYEDVMNYTLSIIENRVTSLIKNWEKYINDLAQDEYSNSSKIENAFLSIANFIWFIFFSSSSVPSAIRVSRILLLIIKTIKYPKNRIESNRILKIIYENSRTFIKQNSKNSRNNVETYYLLVLIEEIGKGYRLPEIDLMGIYNNGEKDYFKIISLLFYIKGNKKYVGIKKEIECLIEQKFTKAVFPFKSAEHTFLLFDLITCPFIDDHFKKRIVSNIENIKISNSNRFVKEVKKYNLGFTNWVNFSLAKELDFKKGMHVY